MAVLYAPSSRSLTGPKTIFHVRGRFFVSFGAVFSVPRNLLPATLRRALAPRVGIFAYGSILTDPGFKLKAATESFIPADSPFPVEYARYSASRSHAPTLVPVLPPLGGQVRGRILVLRPMVDTEEAKWLLWCRETHKEHEKPFRPARSPKSVQIAITEKLLRHRPRAPHRFPARR